MKRSLWAMLFSVVLLSSGVFANTRIFFAPNDGGGDNFAFRQSMIGITISIDGGTPYGFFNVGGYAPGSVLGGSADVFFSGFDPVTINGTQHDLLFRDTGTLFMSSIALPTNGQSFTAKVVLDFVATGIVADTGQVLNI